MSRNEIDDAVKAKALLDNEFLNLWWESAEKNLYKEMASLKISNTARLIELKATLDALKSMRRDLERYARKPRDRESQLGSKRFLK